MEYRIEIDGLRAVAIVPIIMFHAGVEQFCGGFVGVDIFFVISGYLITSIIVNDIESSQFSIVNFYERRARRILPALNAVLMVCAIYTMYQAPFAARDLSQSIAATAAFSQNILLFIESNSYFDLASEQKPLLHMWTLGVEEQFYLLFPILLLALRKVKPMNKIGIFFVAALSSLWLFNLLTEFNSSFSFYMLITRAWELMLGAIAAVLLKHKSDLFCLKKAGFYSLLGMLLIVLSIFKRMNDGVSHLFPTILSVVGASLIILFAHEGTIVKKMLSSRWLARIGMISYGMYLWHQPVLVFYRNEIHNFQSSFGLTELVEIFIITISFSVFSYMFIEKPFRNRLIVGNKLLVSSLLYSSAILITIGYYGHISVGYENWKLNKVSPERRKYYISHAREMLRVHNTEWGKIRYGDSPIVVIGDSMSSDFQMSLKSVGVEIDRIQLDGLCFDEIVEKGSACNVQLEFLKKRLHKSKLVVLASDFAKENSIGGVKKLYSELSKVTKVMVLGAFRFKHASDLAYRYIVSGEDAPGRIFALNIDPRNTTVNHAIKNFVGEVNFIDKEEIFCRNRQCMFYIHGKPLFYDNIHMTIEGWSYFGKIVKSKLAIN